MEDGSVAQLVEQRPEEPCVTGSSPVGATKLYLTRHFRRFFSGRFLLSTLWQTVNKLEAFLRQKNCKNMQFLPLLIRLLIP